LSISIAGHGALVADIVYKRNAGYYKMINSLLAQVQASWAD
jgi:hypothetical protein